MPAPRRPRTNVGRSNRSSGGAAREGATRGDGSGSAGTPATARSSGSARKRTPVGHDDGHGASGRRRVSARPLSGYSTPKAGGDKEWAAAKPPRPAAAAPARGPGVLGANPFLEDQTRVMQAGAKDGGKTMAGYDHALTGRLYGKYGKDSPVSFKANMTLRNHRADLLRIRNDLQQYVATKFRNVRDLYAVMDIDKDGVISMADWLEGCRQQNLPVTAEDARMMFTAIDIDSDNGLSYNEMLTILEPKTLTSFEPAVDEAVLERLRGFNTFTSTQVQRMEVPEVVEVDPLHEDIPGEETPRRAALRHRKDFQRPPIRKPSRRQRANALRNLIEYKLSRRDEPGTKRFLHHFQMADTSFRGYLDHDQFRHLLGAGGLNLMLKRKEENLLIRECDDGHGAIEAQSFCNFLATDYVKVEDAMLQSQIDNIHHLATRVADESERIAAKERARHKELEEEKARDEEAAQRFRDSLARADAHRDGDSDAGLSEGLSDATLPPPSTDPDAPYPLPFHRARRSKGGGPLSTTFINTELGSGATAPVDNAVVTSADLLFTRSTRNSDFDHSRGLWRPAKPGSNFHLTKSMWHRQAAGSGSLGVTMPPSHGAGAAAGGGFPRSARSLPRQGSAGRGLRRSQTEGLLSVRSGGGGGATAAGSVRGGGSGSGRRPATSAGERPVAAPASDSASGRPPAHSRGARASGARPATSGSSRRHNSSHTAGVASSGGMGKAGSGSGGSRLSVGIPDERPRSVRSVLRSRGGRSAGAPLLGAAMTGTQALNVTGSLGGYDGDAAMFNRTAAGLTVASHAVLEGVAAINNSGALNRTVHVDAPTTGVVQPKATTAAYASETDRFDRSQVLTTMDLERRKQRDGVVYKRKVAAEARLVHALEQEHEFNVDKERRRVNGKGKEQLRYFKSVLFGGHDSPQGQTVV